MTRARAPSPGSADGIPEEGLGLTLIDATHAATERSAVPLMARALGVWKVEVCELVNPFEKP